MAEEASTSWSTATADEILADIRGAKRRIYEDTAPRFVSGCPNCLRPVYSTDTTCESCGKRLPWAS